MLPDPHTLGSQQDVESEVRFLLQIRGEMSDVAEMINHIERTRQQLQDVQKMLGDETKYAPVVKAAKELEQKAVVAERKLVDPTLTGRTEDSFRAPMGLYERLTYLGALLNGSPGEGSSGADLPPTDQAVEVNKEFQQQITDARRAFEELTTKDTVAFNEAVKANHLTLSILP